jgi:NADH-quinone oxidoreductase subunit L
MAVSTGLVIAMILYAYSRYVSGKQVPEADGEHSENGIYGLLYNKYHVDDLYYNLFWKPLNYLSNMLHFVIDRSVIDGVVNGVGGGIRTLGAGVRMVQSGSVTAYLMAMVVGIVLIVASIYIK